MARPLRPEVERGFWHAWNRGNERRNIVRSDRDRRMFLALLAETVRRFSWHLHDFVLSTKGVGVEDPTVALDGAAEVVEEPEPVLVVAKDVLTFIATRGDVPQGTGVFESKLTCHNETEAPSEKDGRQPRRRKRPKTSSEWKQNPLGMETRQGWIHQE